jgi:hypothetical protein
VQLREYVEVVATETCSLPAVAFVPDHAPVAVQLVTFCDDHVSVAAVLRCTNVADAARDTDGAGATVTLTDD